MEFSGKLRYLTSLGIFMALAPVVLGCYNYVCSD